MYIVQINVLNHLSKTYENFERRVLNAVFFFPHTAFYRFDSSMLFVLSYLDFERTV